MSLSQAVEYFLEQVVIKFDIIRQQGSDSFLSHDENSKNDPFLHNYTVTKKQLVQCLFYMTECQVTLQVCNTNGV